MRRVNFAHLSRVMIDVCAQHGLWFDQGELEQIGAFVDAGGLRRSRARAQAIASAGEPKALARQLPEVPTRREAVAPAVVAPEVVAGALEVLLDGGLELLLELVVELVVAMLG
jgi:hypothetical protein